MNHYILAPETGCCLTSQAAGKRSDGDVTTCHRRGSCKQLKLNLKEAHLRTAKLDTLSLSSPYPQPLHLESCV